MSLVTFIQDVFPYVKGDIVDLAKEEKARIDGVIAARNMQGDVYTKGADDSVVDTVDDVRQASAAQSANAQEAARQNAVDQAAQLEAQRNSVAEPANPDALGIKAEEPQVVTGTEPVDGVEVTNPNEATDIGSGKGADVKVSKATK